MRRLMRVGGPDLLPVDDPFIADQLGAGAERGKVGTGIGFREALGPDDVPAQSRGDEARLLFLGSPFEKSGDDQLVSGDAARRRARLGRFLAQDFGLRSEETTSDLQSLLRLSYDVF